MATTLKTVQATVSADGVITLAEPVFGVRMAVVTLLVDDCTPNSETLEAISEPIEDLPRYRTAQEAKAMLGI